MDIAADKLWMIGGSLLYGLAMVLALTRVLRRHRPPHNLLFTIVLLGWLLQTVGIYMRGMEVKSCPIGNVFEVLQFVSWSIVLLFLATGVVFRMSLLGSACATIAAALSLLSLMPFGWDSATRGNYFGGNPWIETHAALAFFSYGIFGLLAALACLYLLQDYSLKRKQYPAVFRYFPSIVEMDVLFFRLLLLATAVYTFAVAVGAYYFVQQPDLLQPGKLILTVLLWAGYLAATLLNLNKLLIGKKLAWTCLILFAGALLSLWPVESNRRLHETTAAAPAACIIRYDA